MSFIIIFFVANHKAYQSVLQADEFLCFFQHQFLLLLTTFVLFVKFSDSWGSEVTLCQ